MRGYHKRIATAAPVDKGSNQDQNNWNQTGTEYDTELVLVKSKFGDGRNETDRIIDRSCRRR